MPHTARLLTLLAVIFFPAACARVAPATPAMSARGSDPGAPALAAGPLQASPRRIVGRILAVDAAQGFAFVFLASDPPAAALSEGTDLLTRTLELRETARLRVSRYLRGRTLGTKILSGQPSPGDEVVFQSQ